MKKDNFYKTQIEGFSEVAETARVIEKSAASRIHFLKKKTRALSEYKRRIHATLGRLSRFYWNDNHPLLQERVHGERVLLVITGDQGIVGGLYHELINEVIIKSKDYEHIWIIGNKGEEYLSEEGIQAERALALFNFDNLPRGEKISSARNSETPLETKSLMGYEISNNGIHKMAERIFERFQETNLKKVDALYAKFISLAKQSPVVEKFLPFNFIRNKPLIVVPEDVKMEAIMYNKTADDLPIFEPSKKFIFNELLKKYINVSFAEIVLEARLSEFAARTVTAESAVQETERLIKTFNREFLKAKHLIITQKQVESFNVHQLTRI